MKKATSILSVLFVLFFVSNSHAKVEVTVLEKTFVRSTGSPITVAVTFSGVSGPAIIQLVNGNLADSLVEPVSSSKITLNGNVLLSPEDFNQNVSYLEKPVMLYDGQNTLEVLLKSKPGGQVTIKIVRFIEETIGVIGADGGVLQVDDPDSPINGAQVIIPAGAIPDGTNVTVHINYDTSPPGPIDSGISVGNTVVLSKDYEYNFMLPVEIIVPYGDMDLDEGDIPGVFYWDPFYNQYSAVGIREIDQVNKTIKFSTIHFSKFTLLAVKGFMKNLFSTDSGFRPNIDGFFHPNFGTYITPNGNCLGMALFSNWYYAYKKSDNGLYKNKKYLEGNINLWEDDAIAREIIGRSFSEVSQLWAALWKIGDFASEYLLPGDQTGAELIQALTITKKPQTLLFQCGLKCGHAVLVYKWDISTGKFYIYDNNFPGDEVTVDWNPLFGFSNYSKEASYGNIFLYAFEGFSSFLEKNRFEKIYSGAENGWPSSIYNTITIDSPTIDSNNVAIVPNADNVTVTGKVSGGQVQSKYLIYSVNGNGPKGGLSGDYIELNTDGTFSFTIPHLPLPENSVRMVTAVTMDEAVHRIPSTYAGFKELQMKLQQTFLTNIGFETGSFEDWTHETHTWQNSTPNTAPGKSAIVSQGFDPIYTTLPMVYKGNYAVRINNSDNYYHISSISKTINVPTVALPTLRFYWAAVLEDPEHDAAHQPYIDIQVTDDTTRDVLYSKHHFSNDPSYSGWQSVFSDYSYDWWRVIPWQLVLIDLNSAMGHQVTLKITAADCGYGGHGGYLYFDGDE